MRGILDAERRPPMDLVAFVEADNRAEPGTDVLEKRVALSAGALFRRVIYISGEDEIYDYPFLTIGTIAGPSHGNQDIEGDGVVRSLDLSNGGSVLDVAGMGGVSRIDGRLDGAWSLIPFDVCRALLGEDADAAFVRMEPLRLRVIRSDPVLDGVNLAIAQAALSDDRESQLYVEQGMLTLLRHMAMIGSGRIDGSALVPDDRHYARGRDTGLREREAVRLRRVLEAIEAGLGDDLRVGALAAEAQLSPSAFSRMFKAAMGRSVWRYVRDRRVLRAADRLAHTDASIVAIALGCGFSSQSHLTAAFRDRFGVTPRRYRAERGRRAVAAR